ncbi:hypothetical protein E2562_026806 [Oryza meyeriana var. granulata]|uniref:Uncharacterized protein n=1 Tax=Oryza meyeriana var. granulata TaxID=110450 RepID=A0A6G1CIV2_9ORYZ|nr:hypothetical protein E2562_026806 [Oryza meyeriana var. granulata]
MVRCYAVGARARRLGWPREMETVGQRQHAVGREGRAKKERAKFWADSREMKGRARLARNGG